MVGQVLNTALNILMLPYLARALEVEEYGTYGQVILIGSIVQVIFALGLSNVLFVQLAREENRERDVFLTNIILASISGSIGALVIFATSGIIGELFVNGDLTLLLNCYVVYVVFSMIITSLDSTLIFFGKVKSLVTIGIATNIIRILLLFVSVQFFHSLILMVIAIVSTSFLSMIVKSLYVPRHLFNGKFSKLLSLEQLKIGIPLGLTGTIGMLLTYTDGFMISVMLDTEEFAFYRMGAIELPFIATIYGAVATILLPEITKLYSQSNLKEIVFLKKKLFSIQQF